MLLLLLLLLTFYRKNYKLVSCSFVLRNQPGNNQDIESQQVSNIICSSILSDFNFEIVLKME